MARTKQTAKKNPISNTKSEASKESFADTLKKVARTRRVNKNLSVLREIRKAQDAIFLCLPKLSFRRIVKELSDQCRDGLRWQASALDCLQESMEDYMIECFNDSCILAAHAHRVTVMNKDINTLIRLRHRDPLSHPIDFIDKKMREILLIPPARKLKQKIQIEEITDNDIHDHETRLNVTKRIKLDSVQTQTQVDERRRELEVLEITIFPQLETLKENVDFMFEENGETRLLKFRKDDLKVLKSYLNEVTDIVLHAALSLLKMELPNKFQEDVVLLPSHISVLLEEATSMEKLKRWIQHCSKAKKVILPFNNRLHWSLAIIEVMRKRVLLFDSIPGIHYNIRKCCKKLIAALEMVQPFSKFADTATFEFIEVPRQEDSHSCGWRVLYHAKLYFDFITSVQDEIFVENYIEEELKIFRLHVIKKIIYSLTHNSFKDTPDIVEDANRYTIFLPYLDVEEVFTKKEAGLEVEKSLSVLKEDQFAANIADLMDSSTKCLSNTFLNIVEEEPKDQQDKNEVSTLEEGISKDHTNVDLALPHQDEEPKDEEDQNKVSSRQSPTIEGGTSKDRAEVEPVQPANEDKDVLQNKQASQNEKHDLKSFEA